MAAQRALAALVIVVGVVAIGAAAAGVEDTSTRSGVEGDFGGGSGEEEGQSGNGTGPGAPGGGVVGLPGWVIEAYFILTLGVFSLVGLAAAAYYVWKDRMDAIRRLVGSVLTTVLGFVIVVVLFVAMIWLAFDLSSFEIPPAPPEQDPGGPSGPTDPQPETATGIPPLLLVGAVVVVLVLAVVLVRRYRTDEADEPTEAHDDVDLEEPVSEEPGIPTPPADLAEQHPDNPVYRAWQDLATRVGLAHERNRTPGEVANAAIEQGLPREAVATLTRVFSEVRYGHRPVTEERERRARSAWQSIDGTGGER